MQRRCRKNTQAMQVKFLHGLASNIGNRNGADHLTSHFFYLPDFFCITTAPLADRGFAEDRWETGEFRRFSQKGLAPQSTTKSGEAAS